jgi:putative methionine-R-sulfoxide reductase with GAF domain
MDDLFAELQQAVRGSGSRAERAQRAADAIREATECRWVGIYTVDASTVTNDAWSGPSAPAHPSFAVDEGLTAHAIAAAAVAVSNDVARDSRYLTNQEDSGSELIVPVLIGGVPHGTLDIEQPYLGAFNGTAIAGYERIAAVLAPLWADAGG